MGQSYTWTIPIQLTVTVGGLAATVPTIAADSAKVEAPTPEDLGPEVTIDHSCAKRKGYDPNFLGTQIPLPALSESMQNNTVEVPPQFQKNGQKYILNYYHYSVAMNN